MAYFIVFMFLWGGGLLGVLFLFMERVFAWGGIFAVIGLFIGIVVAILTPIILMPDVYAYLKRER